MEGDLSPSPLEVRSVIGSTGRYSAAKRHEVSPPMSSYSSARPPALRSSSSSSGTDSSANAPTALRSPA